MAQTHPSMRPLRVTVLAGGPSAEREISLESGSAVAEALTRRGHQVLMADINADDLSALRRRADVVFPALHGTFGEDGTLQRIMEQRGIAFVGSGSAASATAMDKLASKQLVRRIGLTTPDWELWDVDDIHAPRKSELPVPVVVKPVSEGSSVSTFIVRERGGLRSVICEVIRDHGRTIVERYVAGDEITVGIIGNEALPPICIRPKRGFYDFHAKYRDEHTEYLFDAGHAPAILERARQQSVRVFEEMGCRHLGRVDWILDADGTLWFLEVNTIPGFTSHSLVPKAAARCGIDFEELVDRLVRMACCEVIA